MMNRIKTAIKVLLGRQIPSVIEAKQIPIEKVVFQKNILSGRAAIVTGASGGIGFPIVKSLLECGCSVVASGTSLRKLEKTFSAINCDKLKLLEINYQHPHEFAQKLECAQELLGGAIIDIVISSSGTHTENVDFWNMTPDEYDRVMNINLKGTYFFCQVFAKYLLKHKTKGNIILISSSRGAEPAFSPYGISKWGLNGLTLGLAQTLGKYGITVNSISPGTTATSLIGYNDNDGIQSRENIRGRLIMPVEISNLITFLVSNCSEMISGDNFHISAGRGTWDIR